MSGANGPIANRIGSDSTVSLVFWKWIGDAIVEGPVVNCSTIVESPRFDSDDYLLGGMLRPDSLWIDNQPTIDVFDTWYKQFRASTLQPGLNLGTVVDFLNTMPTFEEWATDCRPATERSERWLEANRAGYLNWAMNSLTRQLRIECRLWLAIHATELRRGGGLTPAVPDEARQALLSVGCRAGSNPHRQFPRWIVAGHFRDSVDPQYATICQIDGSWRVLVVTMTPAIVVEELSRLVGSGAGWSIQSLPPEFFKWTSSGEFNQIFIGQQPVERPAHDILLLMAPSQAYSAIQLAFFRTPQGWVQVGVECCNWPR